MTRLNFDREQGRIPGMDREAYLSELHARVGVPGSAISALVRRVTGATVAATERLIRGDECEMHRVQLGDGSVVYTRIAFPDTPSSSLHDEAWAMRLAQSAGVPAPEVLSVQQLDTDDGARTVMVIREAAGQQLVDVLPDLPPDRRATVMEAIGRMLARLHTVQLSGTVRPDDDAWQEPAAGWRRYIALAVDAAKHLVRAGFSPDEVRRVLDILNALPVPESFVLCHGDISPEHVFVDAELRISGLIDWGMWRGGTPASELAGMALAETDYASIAIGHGHDDDASFRTDVVRAVVVHALVQIGWLVSSGQTAMLAGPAAALRRALQDYGCRVHL